MSIHTVAQGVNSYSQYQNRYSITQTPQYVHPNHSSRLEENICNDMNWDSECLCEQQKQKIAWVKVKDTASVNLTGLRFKQITL
jgi:hypothetical protein